MTGSDNSTPATDGRTYGVTTVNGSDTEPEMVMPADVDTGAYIIVGHPDNNGPVYLGWDDDVTVASGLPVLPGSSFAVELDNSEQQIYAKVPSGEVEEIRYMATN